MLKMLIPPLDTGCKLNVDKTVRRLPEHLLNVLRTFTLRPVSRGNVDIRTMISCVTEYHQIY